MSDRQEYESRERFEANPEEEGQAATSVDAKNEHQTEARRVDAGPTTTETDEPTIAIFKDAWERLGEKRRGIAIAIGGIAAGGLIFSAISNETSADSSNPEEIADSQDDAEINEHDTLEEPIDEAPERESSPSDIPSGNLDIENINEENILTSSEELVENFTTAQEEVRDYIELAASTNQTTVAFRGIINVHADIDDDSYEITQRAVARFEHPLVVEVDGLLYLASYHERTDEILTHHVGEYADGTHIFGDGLVVESATMMISGHDISGQFTEIELTSFDQDGIKGIDKFAQDRHGLRIEPTSRVHLLSSSTDAYIGTGEQFYLGPSRDNPGDDEKLFDDFMHFRGDDF